MGEAMARYQSYFRGSRWDARPLLRHRDCRRSAEENATFGAAPRLRTTDNEHHLVTCKPVKQLAVQVMDRIDEGAV